MKQQRNSSFTSIAAGMALALLGLGGLLGDPGEAKAQATLTIINGPIDFITVDNKNDHWSGGAIYVGGQKVIIPRNLLMDLPANRLTLQDFMAQAPPICVFFGQSGIARGDTPTCNTAGMAGFALIHANRTSNGNVVAGDVFIQKGIEAIAGTVTFIDFNNGYFRLNGISGDDTTGVMVRMNDPSSTHTVQPANALKGCQTGAPNCSADARFTNDPANYTNVFATGYPLCIPSTVQRIMTADLLVLGTTIAKALPDGSGDVLCPLENRTTNGGHPVIDSRRMAPIRVGDSLTAEGNFERINGVRFLSAHSIMVGTGLTTQNLSDQPDYMFLDEVGIDAAGFQNQRARNLFIGFVTKLPEDVLIWSLHYDPTTNAVHELPLASVRGCDNAAGVNTCGNQGVVGVNQIFKIRHDIDFIAGAKPRFNPCAHLIGDPRMHTTGAIPCNNNAGALNLIDMFGIVSPIPHEIQARTGHSLANPDQISVNINGNESTHGQYLFPLGMGLGGISIPEFVEINLDALATPASFSGIPWNLDRRTSPGGCPTPADCTGGPKPLDPFPFELTDPRTLANLPLGPYSDLAFTQQTLPDVRNRILSFVDATTGKANGNATVLTWPPLNPGPIVITPTPEVPAANLPPTINSAPILIAAEGIPYTYPVTALDDAPGLVYSLSGSAPSNMIINPTTGLITWTPTTGTVGGGGSFNPGQAPTQGLVVTVTDAGGLYDKQGFVIAVNGGPRFLNFAPTTARVGQPYVFQPFVSDPNPGDVLTFTLVAPPTGTLPLGPTTINPSGLTGGRFTWTPSAGQVGPRSFRERVTDAAGAFSERTFNVTVAP